MANALKFLKEFWIIVVIFVFFCALVIGYFAGLRVDGGGITRVGTLTIQNVPLGTQVYVDQARRLTSTDGSASIQLIPGSHTVIVDAPGMQPWNELYEITSGEETTLTPILVPKEITKRALTGDERARALATIAAYPLPNAKTPLSLANDCALVSIAGVHIVADPAPTEGCVPPSYLTCAEVSSENPNGTCASTIIFSSKETIRSVFAYPGRTDALIVAAGGLLYVVELDPREPQFFAPLSRGVLVKAAPWSATSIVATEGTEVYEISL